MKKKWIIALVIFVLGMIGVAPVSAADADVRVEDLAEETVNEETEEQKSFRGENLHSKEIYNTVVDEYGNIIEVTEDATNEIESINPYARAVEPLLVNFRTKGWDTTEYTEVSTGISGYTCGAYGADALYLGTTGSGKIKFMLSGVIGEVSAGEVQLVRFADVSSYSYYTVANGKLIHHITTNVTGSGSDNKLNQGPAPSYLAEGGKYLSYDGHYFYGVNQYALMQSDCNAGVRTNAVNPTNPFFNYFQYLPLRGASVYSAAEINSAINVSVVNSSKMKDIGVALVKYQNTYGTNALIIAGIAANESAMGTSSICQQKNNLFGIRAYDGNASSSASTFASIDKCLEYYTSTMMSKEYLNSTNWKYFGGFLGNKASGMNVKYASDPYWGEKAAVFAWQWDAANGGKDAFRYTIGIKDPISSNHTDVNIRTEATTDSTKVDTTGKQSAQAFLVLNSEPTNGFYKIQSDPVLNAARTSIDSATGAYDASKMYLYISANYVDIVLDGESEESDNISETKKDAVLTVNPVNETESQYEIKVSNFKLPSRTSLRAAVWSDTNGQDDVRWYTLNKKDDNTYSTTVKISDHKSSGKYLVHVYYYNRSGVPEYFKGETFYVTELQTGSVEVVQQDIANGTAILRLFGVDTPSGVTKVRFAVWSSANQSDIRWYDAQKAGGYWVAEMDIANHKNNWALYTVHTYATDGNGIQKYVGGVKVDFSIKQTIPQVVLDADGGEIEIAFPGLVVPSGLKNIRAAVWSEQNGQDDVAWYYITANDTGWKKKVKLNVLKSAGKCFIHAYAENKNGALVYLGGNTFEVAAPVLDMADVQTNNKEGTFQVIFDAPRSAIEIKDAEVGVWSKTDKSDIKWYKAQKQQNGSYRVVSGIAEHGYNIGTYQIQIKVTDAIGLSTVVYETSMEFVKDIGPVEVIDKGNETLYDVRIQVNSYPAGLDGVQFAVWSASGGQDDIRWYTATEENETYRCTLDIKNHKTAGTYYIHTYGITKAGQKVYIGGASEPVVEGKASGSVVVTDKSDSAGTFIVRVSDIQSPSGVSAVSIAVWTAANNQKDLRWYSCSKQSDGSYTAKVDIKNHNYNVGEYVVHAYVTMGNQIQSYMGGCRYDFKPANFLYILKDQGAGYRTISIQNPSSTQNVRFAVWSDANGQDDIVWYSAKQAANGAWTTTVKLSNHKDTGKYHVHAYAGNTALRTSSFVVDASEFPKQGWYYEAINGRTYKLYYKNGNLVKDVHDIIGAQSTYRIELNRAKCTVTVYAQDGANGYIIPVKSFACSVGMPATPTPVGTFYTSSKYRWHELNGPSYGQYCTRIVGGVLFHSVPGATISHYNVSAHKYNMLGQPASQGCVRLCVGDAKWIYDYCKSGTQVKIYDDSYPGPFGKPEGIKIPATQNWDPTDPAI